MSMVLDHALNRDFSHWSWQHGIRSKTDEVALPKQCSLVMQQQEAIWALLWGALTDAAARWTSSTNSARLSVIAWTLLQLNSVWEEVASFFKHAKTKKDQAMCSSLVIVASASVLNVLNGNYWRLPTLHGARASWRGPDPTISRGERWELSKLTPLPAPKGSFSSSCFPTGLCRTLPLISSISSLPGPWVDAGPFLTSATQCTFEVLCER